MLEKFHGTQHSELLPPTRPIGQAGAPAIVAYAFLFKQLEFPKPFERLKRPINFQGVPVAGFGIEADPDKPDEAVLANQVQILDYRDPDQFIIELRTKSAADRLILAKIPPAATLEHTIQAVEAGIASSTPRSADPDMPLEVPKVAFDITHDFDELIGHDLLPAAGKPGGRIEIARQIIKFRMDERGVTLRSDFWAKALGATSPQSLIFDKPFLILMQRSDRNRPYFAAWIGNARLLQGSHR